MDEVKNRIAREGNSIESVEARLDAQGIVLPSVPAPVGNFELGVIDGSTLILSGQGPVVEDGQLARGKVGEAVRTEEAYHQARRTGLVLISAMREVLGSLDHVNRILKVFGMVNAVPDFAEHPKVINGCSDLFCEVFGERSRHTRCAIGVGSLPGNITVEIEATVAISANWSGKR